LFFQKLIRSPIPLAVSQQKRIDVNAKANAALFSTALKLICSGCVISACVVKLRVSAVIFWPDGHGSGVDGINPVVHLFPGRHRTIVSVLIKIALPGNLRKKQLALLKG